MRAIVTAVAGLALLVIPIAPAFAQSIHVIPAVAQVRALGTEHRNPCRFASHNPHEFIAARVMSDRCSRLRAQVAAHPDDTRLHAACDRIARAWANRPC